MLNTIVDWQGAHLGQGPILVQCSPATADLFVCTPGAERLFKLAAAQFHGFLDRHPQQPFVCENAAKLHWQLEASLRQAGFEEGLSRLWALAQENRWIDPGGAG